MPGPGIVCIEAEDAVRTLAEFGVPSRQHGPGTVRPARSPLGDLVRRALWAGAGSGLLLLGWQLLAVSGAGSLPDPTATASAIREMFASSAGVPGPGNPALLISVQKASVGLLLGVALAIPLGAVMSGSGVVSELIGTLAGILGPVSPVVWLAVGLVAFGAAGDSPRATLFAVAVTGLWPTLAATAHGVGSLPARYREVAAVFRFERDRYLTRILLPYALPHVLGGVRISVALAWMVVVAAEMLTGQAGIGAVAWEAYASERVDTMAAALVVIAAVGILLDRVLALLIVASTHR